MPALSADLILTGARIRTMDPRLPLAEALAVQGRKIVAIGSSQDVEPWIGAGTQVFDLRGRTVIPGLIDAHIHLEAYARAMNQVDCGTSTVEACLERVRAAADSAPEGVWVLGHGWDQNRWGRYGTLEELDAVAPDRPVFLTAKSLHAAWANSAALRAVGIGPNTPDPPGGRIGRDARGRPNGLLFEEAVSLVRQRLPEVSPEQLAGLLEKVQQRLWGFGLTGVHDFDGARCFQALQILREADRLGLRVVKNLPVALLDHALAVGLRSGFGDDWLRIGHVKVFADGALGPRTAAMLEPYLEEPENRGMLLIDAEGLLEVGVRAVSGGLPLTVHAIGDRANHEVLDALEALRAYERERGLPARPHRIEHLQRLHPDDLPRVAALSVYASMQPIHATSDMEMADRYWGPERVKTAYAWRHLLDSGATLVFGSDAPVESPNPFWGLHAAVTRRRHDGSPGPDGWVPEQRIRLTEALEAYTTAPYRLVGQGHRLGRLAAGYLADLVVLDEDPFEVSPDALVEIKPRATMVDGRWRWGEPA